MTNSIKVRFTHKPRDLDYVLRNIHSAVPEHIKIDLRKELTEAEYDEFASTLLDDRDWLAGHGGFLESNERRVVEVSAPNRTTLFVDPSGSNYGRYVGIGSE